MNEYAQKSHDAGKEVASLLTSALNSMTYEKEVIEGFVHGITTSHRTLQQSTMRGIYALIMDWAEKEERGMFDARNEATVKFCKAVKALVEENTTSKNINFPFI